MINHDIFMQRCLHLAAIGQQYVAPNPMVGAVVVKNGKIIGEGYHQQYGGPHAEVNAINQVNDKSQLNGATIYVSLEPCVHFGKTPPCTNLIIKHKFAKVVIACLDPNPIVAGKGVKLLQDNGIEVLVDVLAQEAKELNKRFFWFHEHKKPFVILKWAQTSDGFCGRFPCEKQSNKITNWYSDIIVHKMRSTASAILVGYNTAQQDNPELTTRKWFGKNPVRIVIDLDASLPQKLKLFDGKTQTIVFSIKPKQNLPLVNYYQLNNPITMLEDALSKLYTLNIQSIIIEGGPKTLQLFIDNNIWNEAHVFTSNQIWHNGIKAPLFTDAKLQHQQLNLSDNYQLFKPNI